MPYDTFLSYSHVDRARADRIRAHLEGTGLSVWIDRNHLNLGSIFRRTISDGLRQSRTITPILTASALESPEVFSEVTYGVEHGKTVVPVILAPQQLTQSQKWRGLLRDINWGHINGDAAARNITDDVLNDIATAIRRGDDRRCPVICVYHFKGGVGKTTISAHLAAQLYHGSDKPTSVLIIDCDAPSNLSSVFLTRQHLAQRSALSQNLIGMLEPNRLRADSSVFPPYEVAPGQLTTQDVAQIQAILHQDPETGSRLGIVPNSITAAKYATVAEGFRGQINTNFQNAVQKLSLDYDFIIIDCNPSTSLLSSSALDAATDILVPMRADKFTADGLENMDELLANFFRVEFVHGLGRERKQLWTLVNHAELAHIAESNEQRSQGRGPEADLLKDILRPLKSSSTLGRFSVSLLDTRIPESGFLRSRPVDTAPLSPDNPPSRNLLRGLSHRQARPTADAIERLAREITAKTRSVVHVVSA